MDGQQNSPGDEPDGYEYPGHHVQEAHEEIGIHAVLMSNVVIFGVPYANRPAEEAAIERILSLTEEVWISCGP